MPRERIENIDDPRIEPYRHLKHTNRTRRAEHFVVEGEKLVERLLSSRFPVRSLLASERYVDRLASGIDARLPVYVAEHALVEAIVGFRFHRGILGCGQRLPAPRIDDLLSPERPEATLVVCPHLADPENLGSIVRLSAAFGIDAVLTGPSCPDPFSRRVLRVSMGAVLQTPVLTCSDLGGEVERLRQAQGFRFAATVLEAEATPLEQARRSARFGLVFGNEAFGLAAAWLARCDQAVTIRMSSSVDSLNVAAAAAIFLYHFGPTHSAGSAV